MAATDRVIEQLLGRFQRARNGIQRRDAMAAIRGEAGRELVARTRVACEARPELRWLFPIITRGVAKLDDVVWLLDTGDPYAIYNACQLLRARGWADDCATRLVELVRAVRTRREVYTGLGAVSALGTTTSKPAHDALLQLARSRTTVAWLRGAIVEAIARTVRRTSRPLLAGIFERATADPQERLAAAAGLARLGRADALAHVEATARAAKGADRYHARKLLELATGNAKRPVASFSWWC